jgi:hypothetical protein
METLGLRLDRQRAAIAIKKCRLLALLGHGVMSELSPFSEGKRKSDFGAVRAAFDPTATLAVHCGNGLDAGFSPYQSDGLSR